MTTRIHITGGMAGIRPPSPGAGVETRADVVLMNGVDARHRTHLLRRDRHADARHEEEADKCGPQVLHDQVPFVQNSTLVKTQRQETEHRIIDGRSFKIP